MSDRTQPLQLSQAPKQEYHSGPHLPSPHTYIQKSAGPINYLSHYGRAFKEELPRGSLQDEREKGFILFAWWQVALVIQSIAQIRTPSGVQRCATNNLQGNNFRQIRSRSGYHSVRTCIIVFGSQKYNSEWKNSDTTQYAHNSISIKFKAYKTYPWGYKSGQHFPWARHGDVLPFGFPRPH